MLGLALQANPLRYTTTVNKQSLVCNQKQPRFLLWSKFKSCAVLSMAFCNLSGNHHELSASLYCTLHWNHKIRPPLFYHCRYHFTEPNNTGYVSQHMRTGWVFIPCRKEMSGIDWTGIYKVDAIPNSVPVESNINCAVDKWPVNIQSQSPR